MPKKAKQTTADIHRAVAQKVIAAMETHGSDWAKSWAVPQGDGPLSMSTGKHYQGVNWLILGMARARRRFHVRPLGDLQAMAIDGRTSPQRRARRDGDPIQANCGER